MRRSWTVGAEGAQAPMTRPGNGTLIMASSEVDDDALRRAMAITRRDPSRAMQLDEMLRDEPGTGVAEFAAYGCQREALGMRPWQEPPCVADENDPRDRDQNARRLLRRMLDAGVSRYEPDPMEALKAKGKRK